MCAHHALSGLPPHCVRRPHTFLPMNASGEAGLCACATDAHIGRWRAWGSVGHLRQSFKAAGMRLDASRSAQSEAAQWQAAQQLDGVHPSPAPPPLWHTVALCSCPTHPGAEQADDAAAGGKGPVPQAVLVSWHAANHLPHALIGRPGSPPLQKRAGRPSTRSPTGTAARLAAQLG